MTGSVSPVPDGDVESGFNSESITAKSLQAAGKFSELYNFGPEEKLSQVNAKILNRRIDENLGWNEEELLAHCGIDLSSFDNLHVDNVGNDPKGQFYRSYQYLINRWNSKAFREQLIELGVNYDELIVTVMQKMHHGILEAGTPPSKRKFINGNVASLSNFSKDERTFEAMPYWVRCVMCDNFVKGPGRSGLDEIIVQGNDGDVSMRDINRMLGGKQQLDDGNKQILIPNSLGICVLVVCKDENGQDVYVSQSRDNGTTTTQWKDPVGSASGAMEADYLLNGSGASGAEDQAKAEVSEELGVELIESELGLRVSGDSLTVKTLVSEERRGKPELLFVVRTDRTANDIQDSFKNATDRNESTKIEMHTQEEMETAMKDGGKGFSTHFWMTMRAALDSGESLGVGEQDADLYEALSEADWLPPTHFSREYDKRESMNFFAQSDMKFFQWFIKAYAYNLPVHDDDWDTYRDVPAYRRAPDNIGKEERKVLDWLRGYEFQGGGNVPLMIQFSKIYSKNSEIRFYPVGEGGVAPEPIYTFPITDKTSSTLWRDHLLNALDERGVSFVSAERVGPTPEEAFSFLSN